MSQTAVEAARRGAAISVVECVASAEVWREEGEFVIFGWYIVGYLFVAGVGAGAFCLAAVACLWDGWRQSDGSAAALEALQTGFYVAPCLLALAIILLMLDLRDANLIWAVIIDPFRSTMTVGAWAVGLLGALSLGLVVASVSQVKLPKAVLVACCVVGIVLAGAVMMYTGLLFSQMKGIDFWRTPWLPALFVASSLSGGMALVQLFSSVTAPAHREFPAALGRWLVAFECLEGVFIGLLLASRWGFSESARQSCEALLFGSVAPGFWGGVVLLGLAFPLVSHLMGKIAPKRPLAIASSVGILAGCFILRYCIVAAASFEPLI